MTSENCNGGPYLYGRWKSLQNGVSKEEWEVWIDAKKYNWDLPRWWLSRLIELQSNVPEAEIRLCVYSILAGLFPDLRYPDIAVEQHLDRNEFGKRGFVDIYCQGVVFEVKKREKLDDKRPQSSETPQDQVRRYLRDLPVNLFILEGYVPRCCVTDGAEWRFYYYDRESDRLLPDEMLYYSTNPSRAETSDFGYVFDVNEIGLLYKLHSFVIGKEWGDFYAKQVVTAMRSNRRR